jgi:hypothetical protein
MRLAGKHHEVQSLVVRLVSHPEDFYALTFIDAVKILTGLCRSKHGFIAQCWLIKGVVVFICALVKL